MSPHEMALACKVVLESPHGLERVALVLPRRPRGRRMHLVGRGSPLGEVACVNAKGDTVCYFDAIDVLAWLAANGLVQVDVRTPTGARFDFDSPPVQRPWGDEEAQAEELNDWHDPDIGDR